MLTTIFSSRARSEIFRLLFGIGHRELYSREIQRRSGMAIGTVLKELKNLERIGLLVSRKDGNRLYYAADRTHPLYPDLYNLVLKTAGLADVLREALESADVQIAFVFGSVARGEEQAESDVDLMVIGNLGLRELSQYLSGVQEMIGRDINPYVLTEEMFVKRTGEGGHFLTQVLKAPKLFIIGTVDELERLGR